MKNIVTHKGGCHCKEIEFEVTGEKDIKVLNCNCSICSMTQYKHYIISKNNFKLLKGSKFITTYKFNTNIAEHIFCSKCGIKSFYIPRSHPNKISVNANCIYSNTIKSIETIEFDGRNWDKAFNNLKENKEKK